MERKYNTPQIPKSPKQVQVKKTKNKPKQKLLECGDIYMLRTDSKKKALAVLQSKLHGERKRKFKPEIKDYDLSLSEINQKIKHQFDSLEKKLVPKIKKTIQKKKKIKQTKGRKVRLGLFAKMLAKIKKDIPKVRNIGIPKFEGISSK